MKWRSEATSSLLNQPENPENPTKSGVTGYRAAKSIGSGACQGPVHVVRECDKSRRMLGIAVASGGAWFGRVVVGVGDCGEGIAVRELGDVALI